GVFEEIELTDCEVTLHPNDVLLLYTDGLVNVRCEDRRPVNPRRLCGFIREHGDLPAQNLVQALLDHTVEHCEPTDDITILVAKRETEEHPV
ncbi:MAG TPA: SpoIIE family protein phosphatase, partial [Armatimonadota bacterium]|nr:SpoIIE family protein phosphatase [Armatimonadota bacterium]